MMFDFKEQFEKQEQFSEMFIQWMANRAGLEKIKKATIIEDKDGVDFWAFCPEKKSFQVKTDFKAHTTGNMAYEMVSQMHGDQDSVIGWGLKIFKIDFLAYIIPQNLDFYIWNGQDLQNYVIKNYYRYRNFSARNLGYITAGVLVRIKELEDLSPIKSNLTDLNTICLARLKN